MLTTFLGGFIIGCMVGLIWVPLCAVVVERMAHKRVRGDTFPTVEGLPDGGV